MLKTSSGVPMEGKSAAPSRLNALALVCIFAISLIRLLGFISDNAVDLLFDDQWDYLHPLFAGEGPWASFIYQHGPPRMGLGGLIEWFVYTGTSWDVRAVSWLGAATLALGAGSAALLASRLRGRFAWSDAAIPLLFLAPIHWESMTMTPSIAPMILPLLLTVLSAWAWTVENLKIRVGAVILLSTLNLFTGYGVCSAPATLGLALLLAFKKERNDNNGGRKAAVVIFIAQILAILTFAHGYHWAPGVPGWRFPVPNWWDYPRFCALMFTSLLGFRNAGWFPTALGFIILFMVVLTLMAATLRLLRGQPTARVKAIWLLAAVSLTYAALTAIGRLPVSIEAAFMWRYITLMTPAVLALGLAAEEWTARPTERKPQALTLAWFILSCAIWLNFTPEHHGAAIAAAKRLWVQSYLQSHDLEAANRSSQFWVYYPDPSSPRIARQLLWLEAHHYSFFRRSTERR